MSSPHFKDQPKLRRTEREFGVPFPGEIVDEAAWTQTALKKLPETGLMDWKKIYGREAPIVLDLGCGNGRFLIGSAIWRPGHDHWGVDILPVVIRYATRRANQRGLSNIRFAVIGARELLENHIEPLSVAEIHCYHPQPYDTPEEYHKRLITPEFLARVHRALIPGGQFFVQTDSPSYWRYIQNMAPHFFHFEERMTCWPDAPRGRTRREIIAIRHGFTIFRGCGRLLPGLDNRALDELSKSLPQPNFSADRSSSELDNLERQ